MRQYHRVSGVWTFAYVRGVRSRRCHRSTDNPTPAPALRSCTLKPSVDKQINLMANTFTQIYLHFIFAVKGREAILFPGARERVHSYIGGIIRDCDHIPIAIGGTENHVHILIAYNVNQAVPDLVREVKVSTTNFINNNHLIPFKFAWQRGYACFSYSNSHVDTVKQYIEHQEEHHKCMTLREETIRDLERRGIVFDEKYLFDD